MPEGQVITSTPGPAEVDVITGLGGSGAQAFGSVAARLMNGDFKANSLRTLDLLRKEEWLLFDTAIVDVARERLGLVQDLVSRGLRFALANAMGTTVLQWERVSDMDPASVSMAGVTEGEYDRIDFQLQTMPIPIFHKEFTLNIRHLSASRKIGETIDVSQARVSTRKVAEIIENTFVNGLTLQAVGGTVYGLTTAPDRNTGSGVDWTDTAAVTGEDIIDQVIAMKGDAKADHMFGPYGIYIPEPFDDRLDNDYKANSDKTIRERLAQLSNITFIRPTERLTANNVVLAQLTTDVLEVIDGIQPRAVQWDAQGGMIINFKVLAIVLPRIRSDYTLQSGIVHYS
jgi:hypothetical protein